MRAIVCVLLVLATTSPAMSATTRGQVGAARQASLLQTWDKELSSTQAKTSNPIIRVIGLLKEMQATIQKEQEEDEALFKELSCWCNSGSYEKQGQIDESKMKIEQLESTIENLSAKEKELTTKIKELEDGFASNKAELAEATALRAKQLKEFHGMELDTIQAIEALKAALVVLGKHAFVQSANWHEFLQLSNTRRSRTHKDEPWMSELKQDQKERSFDYFLRSNDLDEKLPEAPPTAKFLQQETGSSQQTSDDAVVKKAIVAMQAFMQTHHESEDLSLSQDSSQIIGIMKQMKETMETDLTEAQKTEVERVATFNEMRTAKTQEIEEQEKMAEQKEDELATCSMDLAEAKEDLEQTTSALTEFEKFLANLDATCKTASANFEERKKSRLAEIEAVSETIEILTSDEARDAANGTYGAASFLQVSAEASVAARRQARAAALLRRAALKSRDPQLALLATNAELDGFEKVKKAMDDLAELLKTQQADEVKKNDYCKDELQENEMNTMKK
jgi:cell division protein FtsB